MLPLKSLHRFNFIVDARVFVPQDIDISEIRYFILLKTIFSYHASLCKALALVIVKVVYFQ